MPQFQQVGAQAVLKGSAEYFRDLGKMETATKGFGKSIGPGLALGAGIGATALAGLGAAAIKAATSFETTLSQIAGLTSTPKEAIGELREEILKMASEVALSPDELGAGAYFILSSGISDTATAMKVLELSAKAASAGLGDTKTIANALTSVMNAYQLSAGDAGRVTDTLVNIIKFGKGEPAELAASLGFIIPIAAQMGVSFEQLGAVMATLTNTGLDAAESTTALRGVLSQILSPSKQSAELLEKLGLSAEGLRKEIKEKGLIAAMQHLMEVTGGNEAVIAELFPDVRGLIGVLAAFGNQADQTAANLEGITNGAGALDHAFEEASQTTGFKLKKAMVELKVALIQVGDVLLPVVSQVAEAIATLVGEFTKLPGPIKTVTVVVGGLALALLAATAAATPLIGVLSAIGVVPLVIIAAIAALVAGLVILERETGAVSDAFNAALPTLKEIARVVRDEIVPIVRDEALKAFTQLKQLWEGMQPTLRDLSDILQAGLAAGLSAARDAWAALQPVIEPVTAFIREHSDELKIAAAVIGTVVLALTGPIGLVVALGLVLAEWDKITAFWTAEVLPVLEDVRTAFSDAGQTVADFVDQFINFDEVEQTISSFGETASFWLDQLIGLGQAFSHAAEDIKAAAEDVFPVVQDIVGGTVQFLVDLFQGDIPILSAIVRGEFEIMKEIVSTSFELVKITVKAAIDNILSIFQIGLALLRGDWGEAWSGLKDIVSTSLTAIKDTAGVLLSALVDIVEIELNVVLDIFRDIWRLVAGSVIGPMNDVIGAVESGLNFVLGLLRNFIQGAADVVGIFDSIIDTGLSGALQDAADSLHDVSVGRIPQLRQDMSNLAGAGADAFMDSWRLRFSASQVTSIATKSILTDAATALDKMQSIFGKFSPKALLRDLVESGSKAKEAGVAIAESIGAGISEGAGAVTAAVDEVNRELQQQVEDMAALTAANFGQAFGKELAALKLGDVIGPEGLRLMRALDTALTEGGLRNVQTVADIAADITHTLEQTLDAAAASALGTELMQALGTAIDQHGGAAVDTVSEVLGRISQALDATAEKTKESSKEIAIAFDAIPFSLRNLDIAISRLVTNIGAAAETTKAAMKELSVDTIQGLLDGLESKKADVTATLQEFTERLAFELDPQKSRHLSVGIDNLLGQLKKINDTIAAVSTEAMSEALSKITNDIPDSVSALALLNLGFEEGGQAILDYVAGLISLSDAQRKVFADIEASIPAIVRFTQAFTDSLTSSLADINLEESVGSLGLRLVQTLRDAIESGKPEAAAAVGEIAADIISSLDDKLPATAAANFGQTLTAYLTAAIRDGTPEAIQAVIDLLTGINTQIEEAAAPLKLTFDSLKVVIESIFTDEALKKKLGTTGFELMQDLNKALAEGGASNIASVAKDATDLIAAMKKELSPNLATFLGDQLMAALRDAIDVGGAESIATLEAIIAQINALLAPPAKEATVETPKKVLGAGQKKDLERLLRPSDTFGNRIPVALQLLGLSELKAQGVDLLAEILKIGGQDLVNKLKAQGGAFVDLLSAQGGLHGLLRNDALIRAHAGERVDISSATQATAASISVLVPISVSAMFDMDDIKQAVHQQIDIEFARTRSTSLREGSPLSSGIG